MKTPIPKTKMDELGSLINSFKPYEVLSEFNYVRCMRLLDSSKQTAPKDLWHVMKGLIELNANNLSEANVAALYVLNNSNNFSCLRNAIYIFNHTFDFDNVCKTVDKIVRLIEIQKMDSKGILPKDLGLIFLLNGELWAKDSSFYCEAVINNCSEHHHVLVDINGQLDISENDFKKISCIIKSTVFKNNARVLNHDYSFIDEEFLFLIYINQPIKEIMKINEEIIELCFKEGLLTAYNKISYTFVPFSEILNG
ncbi:hypothetical protein F937_03552 [Acinetobacter calcoaceticus ANC 3680]|uniref:hypothetical protein n=1 Tax=Acinetobacter calcoaceticus TaxID=471 RepID=UPI0002CEEDCD|nr:hypothetical protein [Acinetobacter calcoaceticus]ENV94148.1 hypothetical protein F937_03552 [Acinetobacter calcoaceticus ANC 3680]